MRGLFGTILEAAMMTSLAAGVARADRIDEIMAKMTLREKIGQCVQEELAKIPVASAEETAK